MALTRKYLKELGVEADKIDLIIEAHVEAVDALKDERDTFKEEAGEAKALKAKVEELEKNAGAGDEWADKYKAEHEAFEAYKAEIDNKEILSNKTNAYRELLKGLNVADKRIDAILKVTDVNALELVDGKLKDAEALTESIKTEWAEFIPEVEEKGADVHKPLGSMGVVDLDKLSMEEYISARNK